ncbi:hypothetical protein KIL84_010046 [Mauremys mutica]|uniref:Uncharacterized protein n=1 Tax=Mauremys mutica TaxID=74926 RepID=A0A9D4AZF7_9SAUR|nr:hypothetical protein KIL84_010046 [Mauremys mutica]
MHRARDQRREIAIGWGGGSRAGALVSGHSPPRPDSLGSDCQAVAPPAVPSISCRRQGPSAPPGGAALCSGTAQRLREGSLPKWGFYYSHTSPRRSDAGGRR